MARSQPAGAGASQVDIDQAADDEAVGDACDREIPTGTETILVVVDDPNVRAVAQAILVKQGYAVLVASSLEPNSRYLQKPLTMSTFARRVRLSLDEAAARDRRPAE